MRVEIFILVVLLTLLSLAPLGMLSVGVAAQTTAGLSIIAGVGWIADYIKRHFHR